MIKIHELTKVPHREQVIALLITEQMKEYPVYAMGYFSNGYFYPDRSSHEEEPFDRIAQGSIHSYMTIKEFIKMVKRDEKAREIIELMNQLKAI